MTIYDVAGVITKAEAQDIQKIAENVLKQVRDWLAQTHPTLLQLAK